MIQDTSLDAWIVISQSLGPRQTLVYQALRNNPASNKTLAKRMNLPINQITPRVLELRKKNLVKKMYEEEDNGHTAKVWGVCNP